MFEVKYPESHGLDGKVHKIEIIEAYEVMNGNNKIILVYGQENRINTMLTLKFSNELNSYIFIPFSKMEMINLTSEFLERVDITAKLIREIDGKHILNNEEARKYTASNENSVKEDKVVINNDRNEPKVFLKEDLLIDDSKDVINNFTNNQEEKEANSKEDTKDNILNTKDIMEVFSRYKKESLNIIYKFLSNNEGKYENNIYELEILKLVNELMNTIVKVRAVIFTEDDLIDIGSLLAKLSFERVKNLNQNEFDTIINSGYVLNDNLKERIIKTNK